VPQHTYQFAPMAEPDARAIKEWRYGWPYSVYNTPEDEREAAVREMLDQRSPYFAAYDETRVLVGFFAYGTAAEVGVYREPRLFAQDGMLSVGLGMRPDLTGQGRGLEFVAAGLAHARALYQPRVFRLFVLTFNTQAQRVYERAGFERMGMLRVPTEGGVWEFIEMRREA
jgi:RimJ/RimL family protein N-acetyltransferase